MYQLQRRGIENGGFMDGLPKIDFSADEVCRCYTYSAPGVLTLTLHHRSHRVDRPLVEGAKQAQYQKKCKICSLTAFSAVSTQQA